MSRIRKSSGALLLLCLLLFAGTAAFAAAGGDTPETKKSEQQFDRNEGAQPGEQGSSPAATGTDVWSLLRNLAIVVGLILLAGWLLRKYGRMAGIPLASDRMRVIAALPLKGPNSLYIVEIDGLEMLVGVADGQIGLLKELPGGPETTENPAPGPQTGIESGTIEVNTDVSKRKDFSESLKTSIQRQEMENQAKRSESLKDKLSGLIDKSKSLGDLD